jgi:hypothetical protein
MIVSTFLIVIDIVGAFIILGTLLHNVLEKDTIGIVTKMGMIFSAIGLITSFIFILDATYGNSSLPLWEFPVWGFKDLGIFALVIGVFLDYRAHRIL